MSANETTLKTVQVAAFIGPESKKGDVAATILSVFPDAFVGEGGSQGAISYLQTIKQRPRLLFLVADDIEASDGEIAAVAAACSNATGLIAIGARNDVLLYRQLLAQGCSDYLPKPVTRDAIKDAAQAVLDGQSDAPRAGSRKGKVAVVIGAHGGAGATSVAVNAAWLCANETHKSTALLDLDLQFGTVALSLDLVPGPGLSEALQNPNRIDSLFLTSTLMKCGDKLSVLAAEEDLEKTPELMSGAAQKIISALTEEHDWIWVDLPRTQIHPHKAAIDKSHVILIVSELSMTGMRDALRLKTLCKKVNEDADIRIVLNRLPKVKNIGVSEKQFTECVGLPIFARLSEDKELAANSMAEGRCFAQLSSRARVTGEMRKLTESLCGPPPKSGALNLLKSWTNAA